jgi:hypothetical protein
MIAMAALVTGRISDARDLLAALVADARALGKIGWLPTLLACLAQALLFDGRHCDTLAGATEALAITRGIAPQPTNGGLLPLQGVPETRHHLPQRTQPTHPQALTAPLPIRDRFRPPGRRVASWLWVEGVSFSDLGRSLK